MDYAIIRMLTGEELIVMSCAAFKNPSISAFSCVVVRWHSASRMWDLVTTYLPYETDPDCLEHVAQSIEVDPHGVHHMEDLLRIDVL